MRVQHARVACLRIDALDAAAVVVIRRAGGEPMVFRILAAAIVADVERAVWPDRGTVGTAACLPNFRQLAVRPDVSDASPLDVGDDQRAVRHHHWAFREAEAA